MNAEQFEKLVGRKPERDDLHRVNCDKVGQDGHIMCGFCKVCNKPRYECGHISISGAFVSIESFLNDKGL